MCRIRCLSFLCYASRYLCIDVIMAIKCLTDIQLDIRFDSIMAVPDSVVTFLFITLCNYIVYNDAIKYIVPVQSPAYWGSPVSLFRLV